MDEYREERGVLCRLDVVQERGKAVGVEGTVRRVDIVTKLLDVVWMLVGGVMVKYSIAKVDGILAEALQSLGHGQRAGIAVDHAVLGERDAVLEVEVGVDDFDCRRAAASVAILGGRCEIVAAFAVGTLDHHCCFVELEDCRG